MKATEFLKGIWNKIFSDNEKSFKANGRYKDLAPEKSISNGHEYFKEIEWALNNPNINNMALAGPYGAGKSSIIESFFAQEKKYKPIIISMASFKGTGDKKKIPEDDGDDNQWSKIETEEIARGFLQQLFYKVDHSKIPQSRFRKLHRVSGIRIFSFILFAVAIVGAFFFIFDNQLIVSIFEKSVGWGAPYGINRVICGIISAMFSIILIALASCSVKWIWTHVGNAEINIADKAKISTEKGKEENIFNKYLDEIVYFFEATDYDVVILEDIDRFENTEIFVKLRELNRLLNSYESIDQHIVFVYALKDDFFETSTDRTKFFDFIVSVIPYINSTNSDNLLRRRIEEIKNSGMDVSIDDDYITRVAPFISDMRVLTSIFNDFVLYKNTLNKDKELKLSDEQMLSLMIYKNLHPQEFAAIESEQGVIKDSFKAKKQLISDKTDELQKELVKLKQRLEAVPEESLSSVEEYKLVLLFGLAKKNGTVSQIQTKDRSISTAEVMTEEFDLNLLCNTSLAVTIIQFNGKRRTENYGDISELGYDAKDIIARWEILKLKDQQAKEESEKRVEELRSEIYQLKALKIKDMISRYGVDFLSQDDNFAENNRLLVFFLRNGYIDENYVNYINYFHPDSITIDEQKFILSVRNYEGASDNEQEKDIIHKQRVIDRLISHEFRQVEILNYSLVQFLLSSNRNYDKQSELLSLLSSRTGEVKEFILRYLQKYDEGANTLIGKLSRENAYFWKDLMDDDAIPQDTRIHYFDLILNYADYNDVLQMNLDADDCIAHFIEATPAIFNKLKITPVNKICDLLSAIDFKIKDLDCMGVDQKICNLIYSESKYEINNEMLRQFVKLTDRTLLDLFTHAKHTVMLRIGNTNVLQNLSEHFDDYITNVVFLDENRNEEIDSIVDLCKKCTYWEDTVRVIDSQDAVFDDISPFIDMSDDNDQLVHFVNHIFESGKCILSWSNIKMYCQSFGISEYIFDLIQREIKDLVVLPDTLDDAFIMQLVSKKWDSEALGTFLKKYKLVDQKIDIATVPKENIKVMLDDNWLSYDVPVYTSICTVYPEYRMNYIMCDVEAFFASISEINLDSIPVDEIMSEAQIDEKKKISLINLIPESEMSYEMALVIRNTEMEISKPYVVAAWDLLEQKEKYQLLLNHIDVFENSELPALFNELEYMYRDLAKRNRHKVSLYASDYNISLVNKLEKRRYISSSGRESREKTVFDPVPRKVQEEYVYAWVRAST